MMCIPNYQLLIHQRQQTIMKERRLKEQRLKEQREFEKAKEVWKPELSKRASTLKVK